MPVNKPETQSKSLATVQTLSVEMYQQDNAIAPVIEQIKEQYKDLVFDVSTAQGRKDCKAIISEITKTKSAGVTFGDDYARTVKALPKIIDANRNKFKESMDELKTSVRAPLTEWENVEKQKKADKAKAELQKQIDIDREIAMMMMERDLRFIAIGEEFLRAELEHEMKKVAKAAAEKAVEDLAAKTELAQLKAKAAEAEAEATRIENKRLQEQAEENKRLWEAGAEQRKADEEKRIIDQAIQNNLSSLDSYLQNIKLCQSFELLDQNYHIFESLRLFSYGEFQARANDLIDQIITIDQGLRNYFSNEQKRLEAQALLSKVNIIFPDKETEMQLMNIFVDSIQSNGFLFAKEGVDTLVVSKQVQVEATPLTDEWELK